MLASSLSLVIFGAPYGSAGALGFTALRQRSAHYVHVASRCSCLCAPFPPVGKYMLRTLGYTG